MLARTASNPFSFLVWQQRARNDSALQHRVNKQVRIQADADLALTVHGQKAQ